jgi:hypothetical protein
MSIGSDAAGVAERTLREANDLPSNVPGSSENPSGLTQTSEPGFKPPLPEEAIPSDLGHTQPLVRIPVQGPSAVPAVQPSQSESTPPDFGAFAPKPPENPYAQASSMIATPTERTDQQVTAPEPDWKAMSTSTKAGVLPSATQESPAPPAFDALDQGNLDREVADSPEMRAFYEYVAQDPEAMLAVLQGAMREDDTQKRSDKLRAIGPMVKGWIDRNTKP